MTEQMKTVAPEIKTVPETMTAAFEDFMGAFEAFKDVNDRRLGEIEAKLTVDVVTRDKMERINAATGLALMQRGFRLYLDDWPESGVIQIGRGPVQTIDVVTVYGADGSPVELTLAGAVLDGTARPARLLLPARPAAGRSMNGIEIDFTAGFGATAADVPDTLKRAMLLHVGHLYEFRGAVPADQQPASIPAGYDRLIGPYRRLGL